MRLWVRSENHYGKLIWTSCIESLLTCDGRENIHNNYRYKTSKLSLSMAIGLKTDSCKGDRSLARCLR